MSNIDEVNKGIINYGNLKAENIVTGDKNTINQQFNTSNESIDFEELIQELRQLRENLLNKAKDPEHYISIGEVANAEKAAQEKDESKVVTHLKAAGTWILDSAKEIGINIVTDMIKKQSGL